MKLISVVKSSAPGKKWDAVFDDNGRQHVVHFGATGYLDYTIGASEDQHTHYLMRHKKDLASRNPASAGYCSYYILWGDSRSMQTNIREFKRKFNL
jgi:hypothetical protein